VITPLNNARSVKVIGFYARSKADDQAPGGGPKTLEDIIKSGGYDAGEVVFQARLNSKGELELRDIGYRTWIPIHGFRNPLAGFFEFYVKEEKGGGGKTDEWLDALGTGSIGQGEAVPMPGVPQKHPIGTSWSPAKVRDVIVALATEQADVIELKVPRNNDGETVTWTLDRIPREHGETHFAVKRGPWGDAGHAEAFTTVAELMSWFHKWRKDHNEDRLSARQLQ
jgi:hypothetical protein